MRSVIYSMSVSLDGYIVGPDGSFDWTTPDEEEAVASIAATFVYIDWTILVGLLALIATLRFAFRLRRVVKHA